jgi:outer membrane protein OmpA-like peptidoglycan-associated protein
VLFTNGRFRGSAKKLSQYRADLIKKHLVEKGINSDRLIALGYGGSKMIYRDPKDQEEANKNIRVGVLILSPEQSNLPVSRMSK